VRASRREGLICIVSLTSWATDFVLSEPESFIFVTYMS